MAEEKKDTGKAKPKADENKEKAAKPTRKAATSKEKPTRARSRAKAKADTAEKKETAAKPRRTTTRRKTSTTAAKKEEAPKQQAASAEKEKADKAPAAKPKAPARRPAAKREAPKPAPAAPVVTARAKYVRSSARKARLVIEHVRGKPIVEARAVLRHSPRGVARDLERLLESAVANAENNHDLVGDELYVKEIYADEGPTLKRFRARAQGRAYRIRKRTSHLTVALTPKE